MSSSRRWPAFSFSIFAHAALLAALTLLDSALWEEPRTGRQYRVIVIPRKPATKDSIIWYKRDEAMADVDPSERFGPAEVPRAEKLSVPETLIVHSPNPSSLTRIVNAPKPPEIAPPEVSRTPVLIETLPLPLPLPLPPKPKPSPKLFVPPRQAVPAPDGSVAEVPPAPDLDPSRAPVSSGEALTAQKLPPKPFVAPAETRAIRSVSAIPSEVGNAPILAPQVGIADGLKSLVQALGPAPGFYSADSRTGRISRAPSVGAESSGSPTPGSAVIPDVVARGKSGTAPKPENTAVAVPPRRTVREIALPQVNRTMSAPLRPSSRIIPAAVESQFANRNVYTLVIPGPNVPGYRGDWVLWFSEREQGTQANARVSAPVPVRKYSLESISGAPSHPVSATLQFAAFIDRDGRVHSVKLLRGTVSQTVRAKAIEELESWEFAPALRDGQPVEVEIAVEIPFELRIDVAGGR